MGLQYPSPPAVANEVVEAKWSRVLAVALTAVAIPPLAARVAGGESPDPYPGSRRSPRWRRRSRSPGWRSQRPRPGGSRCCSRSLLLILLAWQLPPPRRPDGETAPVPSCRIPGRVSCAAGSHPERPWRFGRSGAVVRAVERHRVDVLVVQELTPGMVHRLAEAGVDALLPYCHLDPRPGRDGTGLWARWPLAPLPPVPGLVSAAPRARIEPVDGWPVTLTGVHPEPRCAAMCGGGTGLAAIRSTLVASDGQQVVAGDFNATRDHRPFRDLLAAGFLDCADAARRRPWPGFTWPAAAGSPIPPVMRLDHVLVSRGGATVALTDHPGSRHRPPGSPGGYRAGAHRVLSDGQALGHREPPLLQRGLLLLDSAQLRPSSISFS